MTIIEKAEKKAAFEWLETKWKQDDERYAAMLGISVEELHQRVEASNLESRRAGAKQADALIDAGWKFELPEVVNHDPENNHDWSGIESEPWQWYWRSPPKRKGSKGRKYWSTNQAYNAMMKGKIE